MNKKIMQKLKLMKEEILLEKFHKKLSMYDNSNLNYKLNGKLEAILEIEEFIIKESD